MTQPPSLPRRTPAQRVGNAAEADVARRLAAQGWVILGRQVRAGRSELDLVAVDRGAPPSLVVVEVRWRRRRDFRLPEEPLDRRKLAHLRRGLGPLVEAGRLPDGTILPDLPVRLDLAVVEPSERPDGPARFRRHRAIG
jgi:Holliday junction resolvase-like predicted endonuclease